MNIRTLRRCAAGLAVLAALHAPPVRAQASAADALIQEGLKLRREGKPEEALERFRHAHELAPSPRTYGQIGLVEATLKRWTDAETHLSVALANPDDAWVRKNRAFLDQALALCRQHVGDLIVTGPAGAEVFVAGQSVGTLPAVPALRVVEGNVEVTASARGSEPFKESVTVRPGKRTSLNIKMTPEAVPVAKAPDVEPPPPPPPPLHIETPPPPPPPPPPAEPQSHWHTWTGLTLGAVGVGAAAFGITWIAIDNNCTTVKVPSGDCIERYHTKTIGWIAASAGAAVLATGIVILVTGPSKSDTNVALGASPRGLWLQGRF
jgi:PEGA domain